MNRQRGILLGLIVLAVLVDQIPGLRWPLRLLETYFHELSHGLAAVITGGSITRIELNWDGSGRCFHRGGIRLFTAFAGYFGSVLWGVMIYLASRAIRPRNAALLAGSLAATVGLSVLLWMRDPISWIIGGILTTLFALAVRYGDKIWLGPVLQFAGISVLINAIQSPMALLHPGIDGDGVTLSRITLLPEPVWVVVWVAWGLFALTWLWRREGEP